MRTVSRMALITHTKAMMMSSGSMSFWSSREGAGEVGRMDLALAIFLVLMVSFRGSCVRIDFLPI